jgi:hypothetical protein
MAYNEVTLAAATLLRVREHDAPHHHTHIHTLTFGGRWQRFHFDLEPGHKVEAQSALTLGTAYGVRMLVTVRK